MSSPNIPFLDLFRSHEPIRASLLSALDYQLSRSEFVLGDAVKRFEEGFSELSRSENVIGVSSGTAALHLALLALEIGQGDEVIVPSLTFIATAAAVSYVGATPRFVDVCLETWTMDPESLEKAITKKTRAIVVVHLHGLMSDMPRIMEIANQHKLWVVEDAAQAHLASLDGRSPGQFGALACYSFYPGKNLGALGEGGAVATNDESLAMKIRLLRNWGAKNKYLHEVLGYNYRLESLQAAFLGVKLNLLEEWTQDRETIASKYCAGIASTELSIQQFDAKFRHVRHIFAVAVPNRKLFVEEFERAGIGYGFHYPIPLHRQPAYKHLARETPPLPNSERLSNELLSLPMFPGLTDCEINRVLEVVHSLL